MRFLKFEDILKIQKNIYYNQLEISSSIYQKNLDELNYYGHTEFKNIFDITEQKEFSNKLKDGYRFLTWCKYGKKYNSATVIDGDISTHPDLLI